jgi:hypothetical protein
MAAPGDKSAADGGEVLFAAIPVRFFGDRRFTASHHRVLAVISYRDRMSLVRGGGIGCIASHATIASEANVNYANLSALIGDLKFWGAILQERSPMDRRRHVYRVQFTLPVGKPSAENGLSEGKENGGIVSSKPLTLCATIQKSKLDQELGMCNILRNGIYESKDTKTQDSEIVTPRRGIVARVGQGLGRDHAAGDLSALTSIKDALDQGGELDALTRKVVRQVLARAPANSPESELARSILCRGPAA